MKTSPKLFCFILMPFDESYDDVYKLGIRSACDSAGVYCERVDEQIFQETILERVYNQISKADLIIADMSGRNPNVFYEVGYAHAIGKPTILITKHSEDIPFDLKHFQHIVYGEKIHVLKEELSKRITWYVEHPSTEGSSNKIYFDIYMGKFNLLKENVLYICPKYRLPVLKFTIFNPTPYTLAPGSFRIGILSTEKYFSATSVNVDSIALPDNKYIHMLAYLDNLFPSSYASFSIIFGNAPKVNEVDNFIVRLFSEFGTFDYPFSIRGGAETDEAIITTA